MFYSGLACKGHATSALFLSSAGTAFLETWDSGVLQQL